MNSYLLACLLLVAFTCMVANAKSLPASAIKELASSDKISDQDQLSKRAAAGDDDEDDDDDNDSDDEDEKEAKTKDAKNAKKSEKTDSKNAEDSEKTKKTGANKAEKSKKTDTKDSKAPLVSAAKTNDIKATSPAEEEHDHDHDHEHDHHHHSHNDTNNKGHHHRHHHHHNCNSKNGTNSSCPYLSSGAFTSQVEKFLKALENKLNVTNVNGTLNLILAIAAHGGTVQVNAQNANMVKLGETNKVVIVKSSSSDQTAEKKELVNSKAEGAPKVAESASKSEDSLTAENNKDASSPASNTAATTTDAPTTVAPAAAEANVA